MPHEAEHRDTTALETGAALRARLSGVLADLWVDVDAVVPYAAGELLARIRERGTVEIRYRAHDVRVVGRVAPALAGELASVAASSPSAPMRRRSVAPRES